MPLQTCFWSLRLREDALKNDSEDSMTAALPLQKTVSASPASIVLKTTRNHPLEYAHSYTDTALQPTARWHTGTFFDCHSLESNRN